MWHMHGSIRALFKAIPENKRYATATAANTTPHNILLPALKIYFQASQNSLICNNCTPVTG
jgi:hypothetical protein